MLNKYSAWQFLVKNGFIPELNKMPVNSLVTPMAEGKFIPKIIHQTFYKDALPDELSTNIKQLKDLNPSWEYRFYNDNAIISFIRENYCPKVLEIFNKIDNSYGAAKADLFRYLLMYKCGGVYLDIKSSAEKPLDDVLRSDDRYVLSYWKNGVGEEYEGWGIHAELKDSVEGEFQQWYIACAPGHPFLKAVIEAVLSNIDRYNPAFHGVGKYGVLRVTGPIAYTLAIKPLTQKNPFRLVSEHSQLGLKYSIYNNKAHTNIFKSHYSNLTVPLVRIDGPKKYLIELFQTLQRAKRFFSTIMATP